MFKVNNKKKQNDINDVRRRNPGKKLCGGFDLFQDSADDDVFKVKEL